MCCLWAEAFHVRKFPTRFRFNSLASFSLCSKRVCLLFAVTNSSMLRIKNTPLPPYYTLQRWVSTFECQIVPLASEYLSPHWIEVPSANHFPASSLLFTEAVPVFRSFCICDLQSSYCQYQTSICSRRWCNGLFVDQSFITTTICQIYLMCVFLGSVGTIMPTSVIIVYKMVPLFVPHWGHLKTLACQFCCVFFQTNKLRASLCVTWAP